MNDASATVTDNMSDEPSPTLAFASQVSIAAPPRILTKTKSIIETADNDGQESTAYNRKEKSLGELCRRFLFLYGTP